MASRNRRSNKKYAKKRMRLSAGKREESSNSTGVGPEIPPQEEKTPSFLESIGLGSSSEPVAPVEEPVDTPVEEPVNAPVEEGSAEVGRQEESSELIVPPVETKKKRKAVKKGTKKNKKPRARCAAYCRMQKKRYCPQPQV